MSLYCCLATESFKIGSSFKRRTLCLACPSIFFFEGLCGLQELKVGLFIRITHTSVVIT